LLDDVIFGLDKILELEFFGIISKLYDIFFCLFLRCNLIVLDVLAFVGNKLVLNEAVVVLKLFFEEFGIFDKVKGTL
jgi:hypothetical protein